MTEYKIKPLAVTDKEAFFEASADELRVLLALVELDGKTDAPETLARLAKISKARAKAALVFWNEAGVIRDTEDASTITEEFEERIRSGKILELDSESVARSIRNASLAGMISECTALMKRAALNSSEIKSITALYEQYSLSEEYIVMLAAYLAEGGRLTVTKLVNKAISLSEREIDTTRALEEYIVERESESEAEREFRKLFGIYGRAPSKTEKECFKRWSKDYGFFTDIVGEAYDIAVTSATRGHLKYADKLLTRWYETGCRTLSDCKARYLADEAEKKDKKSAQTSSKSTSYQKKPEQKRYGNFDPKEAFMKALERSYGKKE